MNHRLVLLSPYTYPGAYPLTLGDEEMAAWLNAYTALWHPAVVTRAAEPPTVESPYNHETPKPATIYALPASPPNYLPEDWAERVRQTGSLCFTATHDRGATLENLHATLSAEGIPPLGWPEALAAPPDMLSMFFGVGLGYLLQATLAEAMEHENLLEAKAFWELMQKSVDAMGTDAPAETESTKADNPPPADAPQAPADDLWLQHLKAAAQKLQAAREVLYPVAIHWIDLHFLNDASFDQLPSTAQFGLSANIIASAEGLDRLSRSRPERFAILKTLVETNAVEICGGIFTEKRDALLPYDSQLWNIEAGREATKRLLGSEIRVHARRDFAFHPRTIPMLASLNVTRFLFLLFDADAAVPTFHAPAVAFSGPDGKQIDGYARPPRPAERVDSYFNLGNALFKTTREDHHATLAFVHPGPGELPWHRDLVALSKLAPVLGAWTTFSEYFSQTSAGEYPANPNADDFHFDDLAHRIQEKRSDPVSAYGRHGKIRRRIDACWTYASVHRALGGAGDPLDVADHLQSIERVFESQDNFGVEPGGLAEIERTVTTALAERLQAKAIADRPGLMLLNPCAFARRYALEIDGATAAIPVEGVVKACQFEGGVNRVVVEVPALGFAWLPRSGPAGTPSGPPKQRLADAKSNTIRNEFFEAEIDPQTGGLKGIRDHKTRINRVGQRLVFNPGSRVVCHKVETTSTGPALGEIVTEGVLLGEQDQELATFRQRFRAWLGRPLLEMRVELTPRQPAAGDPWHAYFGARFAWRDERAYLFRGMGGMSQPTASPRPQSGEFLDLRIGPMATALFPGGLPFHRKHDGRMLDMILIPEGETATAFDIGIALDRDLPMLTAFGLASPLAVVPTAKGPPHVGTSGWLFHLDMPSLLMTRLLPGPREKGSTAQDAVTAQFLECAGFAAHAEFRCVRNPTRAALLTGSGDLIMDAQTFEDVVTIDVPPNDWMQVQIEFA